MGLAQPPPVGVGKGIIPFPDRTKWPKWVVRKCPYRLWLGIVASIISNQSDKKSHGIQRQLVMWLPSWLFSRGVSITVPRCASRQSHARELDHHQSQEAGDRIIKEKPARRGVRDVNMGKERPHSRLVVHPNGL